MGGGFYSKGQAAHRAVWGRRSPDAAKHCVKPFVSHRSLQSPLGVPPGFCWILWYPESTTAAQHLCNYPLCLDLEGAAVPRYCLLSHTVASFMVSAMPACKSLPGVSLVFLTVPQRGNGEGPGPSPEIQLFLSVICTHVFFIACVVGVGS